MVASHETCQQILKVIGDHVSAQDKVVAIVNDLYDKVDGNQSVRDTITRLYKIVHNMS